MNDEMYISTYVRETFVMEWIHSLCGETFTALLDNEIKMDSFYRIREMSAGENFGTVFTAFHSTANLFPQIMVLSISNISLQNCYNESCTTNSYFPLKMQKVFSCRCFPYMILFM